MTSNLVIALRQLAERLDDGIPTLKPTETSSDALICDGAADEIERLRAALNSIADNTCCAPCQEAANVARVALDRPTFQVNPAETKPEPAALTEK